MNAIEKAKEALEECFLIMNISDDNWTDEIEDRWKALQVSVPEALLALDAEKPAEDDYDLEQIVNRICEPGSDLWTGETSDLDGKHIIYPDDKAIMTEIQQYVESRIAKQCAECRKDRTNA